VEHKDILKNAGNQQFPFLLTSIIWTKNTMGSQWESKLFGFFQHSSKYLLLSSAEERNAME